MATTTYTGYDNVKDHLEVISFNIDAPTHDQYSREQIEFYFMGQGTNFWTQKGAHEVSLTRKYMVNTWGNIIKRFREMCNISENVEIVRVCAYFSTITLSIGSVSQPWGEAHAENLTYQIAVALWGNDNRLYTCNIPPITYTTITKSFLGSEVYKEGFWIEQVTGTERSQEQILSAYGKTPYYTYTDLITASVELKFNIPIFKNYNDANTYLRTGVGIPITPPTPVTRKEYYINTICYKSTDGTKNNKRLVYTHTQTFKVNDECQMLRYTNKNITTRYNHFWNYRNLDNNTFSGREDYIEYNSDGSISTQGSRENITLIDVMLNPYNTGTEINAGGFFAVINSNIPLRDNANDWQPDGEPSSDPQNPTGENDPSTDLPTPDVQLPLARTYALTFSEMQTFANVLYTSDMDVLGDILDGLKMYGENPINFVADVYYIPFGVAPFCTTVNSQQIPFGSYHADIPAKEITHNNSRYTLFETVLSGSFNDYRDYESIYYLYLPYVGIFILDHIKYLNKSVKCECTYDVHSGNMKYYLYADGKLLDMYETSVRVSMPICGTDKSADAFKSVNALDGIVNSTVGAVAGGVANFGNVSGILNSFANFGEESIKAPDKHISGNSSPSNAIFDCTYPYLIIETYDYKRPSALYSQYGYPDNDVNTIGSRSGYIECFDVRLQTSATETERNEILSLLNNGIVI